MRVLIGPDCGSYCPVSPIFYLSPAKYGSYSRAGKAVGPGGVNTG
jgi:hypothetical protein